MEEEEETGPPDNIHRQYSAVSSKDDTDEPRKTQAQRLWEFELWTNDKTLKDLEYSQRRTEKKQRKRDRKRNRRYRRWKMLYLPAVLGMVGGTVLTLTATLQGLGVGTFIWDIRHVIMVIGPVIIAGGFMCLMLAAGCTFKHESEDRKTPKPPEDFISLLGFRGDEFQFRRSAVRHSISMDTEDMPLPVDLDPNRNYVLSKSRELGSPRRPLRSASGGSGGSVFLMSQTSYGSTASWVKSLTVTHQQQRGHLTRQHSDSNLLTSSHGDSRSLGPWCPGGMENDVTRGERVHTTCRSHSDLHVVCTRSLTSSGYHSCASDTTSINLEPRRIATRRGGGRRGTSPVYSSSGRGHSTLCSVSAYGCGARSRSPAKRMHVHEGTPVHTAHTRKHFGSASSEQQVLSDSAETSVPSLNTSRVASENKSVVDNGSAPVNSLRTQSSLRNSSSERRVPTNHLRPKEYTQNNTPLGKQCAEQTSVYQIHEVKNKRQVKPSILIAPSTQVSGGCIGNECVNINKTTNVPNSAGVESTNCRYSVSEVVKETKSPEDESLVPASGGYHPVSSCSTLCDVRVEVHQVRPENSNSTNRQLRATTVYLDALQASR